MARPGNMTWLAAAAAVATSVAAVAVVPETDPVWAAAAAVAVRAT